MIDKLLKLMAKHAPRRFVYYCSVRLTAAATTGRWSHQVVPDLTAMEALERWERRPAVHVKQWHKDVALIVTGYFVAGYPWILAGAAVLGVFYFGWRFYGL